MFKAAVITVSDRCHRGERSDEGGPLVVSILKDAGYEVVHTAIVPDEQAMVEAALRDLADKAVAELIVTTGGTGSAPRDVTPEATVAVSERLCPRPFLEAMRAASALVTNRAMLARPGCLRKGSLIINLPGSPKAARENLAAVLPAIDHGLIMLAGEPADCAHEANQIQR